MPPISPTSTVATAATTSSEPLGVLLVGHGTRDVRGQDEFRQTSEMLQAALPHAAVAACFLELAEPNIDAAVDNLLAHGLGRWVVAPALLFEAAHVRRDIPDAVAAALTQSGRSDVRWAMAEPLACHAAMLELSAQKFREALPTERVRPEETMLVMVGRGTSDASAIAEMRRFTALRAGLTPIAEYQTAFLTGALPTLDEALDAAANSPQQNIVVQPHLLWRGQLIDTIADAVARERTTAAGRRKRWYVAHHLGPRPEVIAALVDRIRACCAAVTPPGT